MPSLSTKDIAFLISCYFSLMFLRCSPATQCRPPGFSSAARSVKQRVSRSAPAQSEKERPSALLGCPAEQVLADSEGMWLPERPSSPWSRSCSLRLVDWLNPDDLLWYCGLLLEMDVPVKVLLLGNDGCDVAQTTLHEVLQVEDNPRVQWKGCCDVDLLFLIAALDLSLPGIFLLTSRIFILFSLLLVENFTTSRCWETPYLVTSANGDTSSEELLGRPPCTCVTAGHQLLKSCRRATRARTGRAARCRSSWIAPIIWPTTVKWGCWLTWA